ncbi:hypothetical protein M413DRAFT_8721 [Hebeloma cylindrosporum]|uniref:F-box domain-containing protein n=1 Tax=Hebeloma cylindrosporum TaxID=76867 RepID=A0A0C3C9Q7_HEBCY|nr:hypothetical protein M413DRAFT_8721 [Hebeloma cylindrosporum h7]
MKQPIAMAYYGIGFVEAHFCRSWEPEENLEACGRLLASFWEHVGLDDGDYHIDPEDNSVEKEKDFFAEQIRNAQEELKRLQKENVRKYGKTTSATPFPHLLRSNIAPSPLEFSTVSKAISDAEALRSSLTSQLIEKKASANLAGKAMTRRKIKRLEKFIAAHVGIVSAIRRVPPEIIQDIFEWLSAVLWEENRLGSKWALPFAYGHICSSWRGSALSVHSLWSLFPEIKKPKTLRGKERQLEYMTELLHRSQQAPIQFSFDFGHYEKGPYPIGDLLVRFSERWRAINIRGSACALRNYFSKVEGRIPNLENLVMTVLIFDAPSNALDMFQTAPKLRGVRLAGHNIGDIKLPSHQLTVFHTSPALSTPINTQNSLSQLTNAYHLKILIYDSSSPRVAHFEMISLPSLKRLNVRLYHPSPSILDFLTVPVLENLRVEDLQRVLDTALLRSIAEMASRSGNLPHLQELYIWSTAEMPEGLIDFLRLTPALTLLELPIPPPRDLLALASTDPDSGLPLITSLELCYFGATNTVASAPKIFSALKEFTDSRCDLLHDHFYPLRELRLTPNQDGNWWNAMAREFGYTGTDRDGFIRQSQLEPWQESNTSALLTTLKERLCDLVPGLSTGNPVLPNHLPKGHWFQNIQDLLDEIKNVEVDDGIDILLNVAPFTRWE